MTVAQKLVAMLEEIRYDTMPQSVRAKTLEILKDYVAAFLCGRPLEPSQQIFALAEGENLRTNCEKLAMRLGCVTRLTDLDDGHRFAMGHPSVATVSAALAVAAVEHTDGKTLVEAVVKGYEIYGFLGRVIVPSSYIGRGFDSTGVVGAVSSAAAVAAIYRLTAEQQANAMAIAATMSGSLTQYYQDGDASKYLCAGWAADLGIFAAKAARTGLTGPREAFEGVKGFCNALADTYNKEYLMNPSLRWEVENNYFKVFACVRRLHAALDGIYEICQENNIPYSEVERVLVLGGTFVAASGRYDPDTLVGGQSSLPFSAAVLLTYGKISLDLLEKSLSNPQVHRLSRIIEVAMDEDVQKIVDKDPSYWGTAKTRLFDKSGNQYEKLVLVARGDRENPFPAQVLDDKFLELAQCSVSLEDAQKLLRKMKALDTCADVSEVLFEAFCI